MAQGYYAHSAAMEVAKDRQARALLPAIQPGQAVPVGYVTRKDGTQHVFDLGHYLGVARSEPEMARVWLVGSLLAVGDALAKQRYFDHAPELELVRHLRNGVAHGNKFSINKSLLAKHPAHNRLAIIKGDKGEVFEIAADLEGQPVLFDFMGPGNILDLLMSVGLYLIRMGNGDLPLRP